jgi:hypothetical protein
LDYWKTTSEVIANYNHDVQRRENDGYDRFNFSIKLVELANLENKTMFFCIRYSANGQDYWDNNNGMNCQVDFTKKAKLQHGKNGAPGIGARPLNGLPSPPLSAGTRPKPLLDSFDDFPAGFDSNFSFNRSSPASVMGDSLVTGRNKAKAQAFGNRYDFVASLNNAIQNAPTLNVTQAAKGTLASTQSSSPAALPCVSSRLYQELVDKYCFVGTRNSGRSRTARWILILSQFGSSFRAADQVCTGMIAHIRVLTFLRAPPTKNTLTKYLSL